MKIKIHISSVTVCISLCLLQRQTLPPLLRLWILVPVPLIQTTKLKPKHLDRPLVAGCSVAHELFLLHVSFWDMGQPKKSKYTLNKFFTKMVSGILGSCYHTNVLDALKMIDS